MIVSEVPGTTRDSIDIRLEREGTTYRLIDTAGLRRPAQAPAGGRVLERAARHRRGRGADVALVLVDASEGITDQDLSVADEARKAGCATLVRGLQVGHQRDRPRPPARAHRPQAAPAPAVVTTSAVTRRGLERLLERIETLHERYTSRMPTPAVQQRAAGLVARRQPPLVGDRRLKLLYGAQVQTRPPRFRITVNDRKLGQARLGLLPREPAARGRGAGGLPVIIDLVER